MQRHLLLLSLGLTLACGDKDADDTGATDADTDAGTDDDTDAGTDDDTDAGTDDGTDSSGDGIASVDLFTTVQSSSEVSCTLTDGTATTCLELRFAAGAPSGEGPYCPEHIDDIGGLGAYDGATNPGVQVMKRALWEAMEADGYDIVDEQGNINVVDPGEGGGPGGGGGGGGPMDPACLQGTPAELTIVYTIPLTPSLLSSPDTIDSVEDCGVSVDGVPFKGAAPSVVGHGGNIPALDPCGGHQDPAGYYHWHIIAESAAPFLEGLGVTDVACTNMDQDDTALSGFAKDGFPIYGAEDTDGAPTDLDECNGHEGATPEFPDGVYHYHADPSVWPTVPPCVKGASVDRPMTYE